MSVVQDSPHLRSMSASDAVAKYLDAARVITGCLRDRYPDPDQVIQAALLIQLAEWLDADKRKLTEHDTEWLLDLADPAIGHKRALLHADKIHERLDGCWNHSPAEVAEYLPDTRAAILATPIDYVLVGAMMDDERERALHRLRQGEDQPPDGRGEGSKPPNSSDVEKCPNLLSIPHGHEWEELFWLLRREHPKGRSVRSICLQFVNQNTDRLSGAYKASQRGKAYWKSSGN